LAKIKEWCDSTESRVNAHSLAYLEANAAKLPTAVASIATLVPGHYAAANRVAHILAKLGKPEAAKYVETKLPTGPRSRSGDIGEILASRWVSDFTDYKLGILKLRWKDHREMAMRGDDILGVGRDPHLKVRFLKGEVKSRATLVKKTVDQARTALLSSDGRPTPHALAFVSDRLFEAGETDLSDLIDEYQLKKRIKRDQMSHLMFMFTGNNCRKLLADDLNAYDGKIQQYAVGLRVPTHQTFIKQIFEKVIADGNKP
jgi:Cap4 SAVED domain